MFDQKKLRASFRRIPDEEPLSPRRRSWWEYVVLLFVLVLSLGCSVSIARKNIMVYRRIVLEHQLSQIRNAIVVFFLRHNAMPPDLATLTKTSTVDPNGGVFFPLIEGIPADAQGRLFDPMGYPYEYHRPEGRVISTAPCCRSL